MIELVITDPNEIKRLKDELSDVARSCIWNVAEIWWLATGEQLHIRLERIDEPCRKLRINAEPD